MEKSVLQKKMGENITEKRWIFFHIPFSVFQLQKIPNKFSRNQRETFPNGEVHLQFWILVKL